MLGIFGRIKDRRLSSSTDSKLVKPPTFERLEPRILLSADSLVNAAAPDPLLDPIPQVVQHAELLETEEQLQATEREVHQEVASSGHDGADLLEPILTIPVDKGHDSHVCLRWRARPL